MVRLVALDLPAGPDFVDALQRAWDAGDAVFPVDQRHPAPMKADLLARFGVAEVVDRSGATSLDVDPSLEPLRDGDALVVATSGTSGEPKGVVLTQGAVGASAQMTSAALDVDPANDHWLCCLPVAHVGGLSVITRALHTGTPLTVHDGFDVARVEAAAAGDVTLVSLVVTALGRVEASGFRRILLGGSAIPTERPANTVATYGMTETGSGVVYEGFALEGVDLRIADGEVQLRSPSLLRCYRDGTDPRTPDGWYPTGDGGSLDPADGRLSVTGRIADVIVTGGEKVWPVAVERALMGLPGISEAAVVGRPDPEWGQAVTALIVPASTEISVELAELRVALSDTLPRYALPRALEIVTDLPRTRLGKVRRVDLR